MAGAAKLRLGANVVCADGPAGTLARFIIDLETGHVTHLDVAHHLHGGRLVSISDVTEGGDEVHLSSTLDQFSSAQPDEAYADIAPAQSFFDPAALVQAPLIGFGRMGMFGAWGPSATPLSRAPFTPKGETYVDRHEPARASDGHHVGHINGLVLEPTTGAISHVLLAEGHVFGKKEEIAIPIDAVRGIDQDGASFALTREQIEALPSI